MILFYFDPIVFGFVNIFFITSGIQNSDRPTKILQYSEMWSFLTEEQRRCFRPTPIHHLDTVFNMITSSWICILILKLQS
jgi:hypothetical protein